MSNKLILILALAAILWLALTQPSTSQANTPDAPKITMSQGYIDQLSSTDPCRTKGLGHGVIADTLTKFASLDEDCALFGR